MRETSQRQTPMHRSVRLAGPSVLVFCLLLLTHVYNLWWAAPPWLLSVSGGRVVVAHYEAGETLRQEFNIRPAPPIRPQWAFLPHLATLRSPTNPRAGRCVVLPVMLLFLPAVILGIRLMRVPHRSLDRACPSCGYDLTGNTSGVCPECGVRVPLPLGPAPVSAPEEGLPAVPARK